MGVVFGRAGHDICNIENVLGTVVRFLCSEDFGNATCALKVEYVKYIVGCYRAVSAEMDVSDGTDQGSDTRDSTITLAAVSLRSVDEIVAVFVHQLKEARQKHAELDDMCKQYRHLLTTQLTPYWALCSLLSGGSITGARLYVLAGPWQRDAGRSVLAAELSFCEQRGGCGCGQLCNLTPPSPRCALPHRMFVCTCRVDSLLTKPHCAVCYRDEGPFLEDEGGTHVCSQECRGLRKVARSAHHTVAA